MTGKDFATLIATLVTEVEEWDFTVYGPSEGKPGQAFMRFEDETGDTFYVEVGKE